MINSDEINLIATGDLDDPAVFKLDLTKPLELDTTWRLGLLEIVIPNTIAFLDPKKDYIEVVATSKKRIRRATNPGLISFTVAPLPVRLGNYFPWISHLSSIREESEDSIYLNLLISRHAPNILRYSSYLEISTRDLQKLCSTVRQFLLRLQSLRREERQYEEIWPPETEARGLRYLGFEKRENYDFKHAETIANSLLDKSWFMLIKNRMNETPAETLKRLYSSLFSNRLSQWARAANLSTRLLIDLFDPVLTNIHQSMQERNEGKDSCKSTVTGTSTTLEEKDSDTSILPEPGISIIPENSSTSEDGQSLPLNDGASSPVDNTKHISNSDNEENEDKTKIPKRTEGHDVYLIAQTPEGGQSVSIASVLPEQSHSIIPENSPTSEDGQSLPLTDGARSPVDAKFLPNSHNEINKDKTGTSKKTEGGQSVSIASVLPEQSHSIIAENIPTSEDDQLSIEDTGMIKSLKRTEGRDIYIIVQTLEGEEIVPIDLSTDEWVSRTTGGCKIVMESNRVEVLTDHLSKVLSNCSGVDFSFDQKTMKVTFHVPDGERLTLHGRLSQIYSVPSVMEGEGVYTSTHCVDPYVDFRTLYIYSDVTQDIILGETKHPLFQTIPLITNSQDLVQHEIFYSPLFLPLKKQHIVKLKFSIYNEIGQKIRFRSKSTSLIRLLFKRDKYGRN